MTHAARCSASLRKMHKHLGQCSCSLDELCEAGRRLWTEVPRYHRVSVLNRLLQDIQENGVQWRSR